MCCLRWPSVCRTTEPNSSPCPVLLSLSICVCVDVCAGILLALTVPCLLWFFSLDVMERMWPEAVHEGDLISHNKNDSSDALNHGGFVYTSDEFLEDSEPVARRSTGPVKGSAVMATEPGETPVWAPTIDCRDLGTEAKSAAAHRRRRGMTAESTSPTAHACAAPFMAAWAGLVFVVQVVLRSYATSTRTFKSPFGSRLAVGYFPHALLMFSLCLFVFVLVDVAVSLSG